MKYRNIVQNIIDNKDNNDLKNQYFNTLLSYFFRNDIDVYEQIGCMRYLFHTKQITPYQYWTLSEWDNFAIKTQSDLIGVDQINLSTLNNLAKEFQMKFENSSNV